MSKIITPQLYVDYTECNGIRNWRPITKVESPYYAPYTYGNETIGETWLVDCLMADRNDTPQTLRLDQIHGYCVGDVS